jgi:probable F420-dependent oxidoreductase
VRPFRFGYQLTAATSAGEFRRSVKAAEAAGFDVLCTFDHLGGHFSALAPLAAAASYTTRIRLCPLVVNNDLHHPVGLAQEIATLDRLSEGRAELGIGAGHAAPEYRAAGLAFEDPATRKSRLAESVEVLRRLLDRETVTFTGEHYQLDAATTVAPVQDHLPILVGVNGRTALAWAAQRADTVGLTMLGRTLSDGQRHEVRWAPDRLDATVEWINDHATARPEGVELNALIQAVVITDDRRDATERLATKTPGLTVADALATPFLAIGTHDEIAAHLIDCRARWGISYYVVRDIEPFAPVIERLRRHDVTVQPSAP